MNWPIKKLQNLDIYFQPDFLLSCNCILNMKWSELLVLEELKNNIKIYPVFTRSFVVNIRVL